ncbi:MAG: alpha/beta hydrolase-fold protein [Ferruginibacter sp.]
MTRQFTFILFFCLTVLVQQSYAQHRLVVEVQTINKTDSLVNIFMAGNFNGWNPADTAYRLKSNGNKYTLIIEGINKGLVEFKFTLGSWNNVETGTDGADIPNRTIDIQSDTLIRCVIVGWKEALPVVKKHTATEQVKLIDTSFNMPQLNRSRRISIYLPQNYKKGKQRYPVIYMHDGQNLFDEALSPFGEWGVDECLDSFIAKGNPAAIIVAIDNSAYRMTEYSPYPFRDYTTMEGDAYLDFIVSTLKPYIDKHYRTQTSAASTTIAGASLGGLISYYGLMKYPETFGNAGIFSPSFWINMDSLKQLTQNASGKLKGKLFFYMGAAEGERYINDLKAISDLVGEWSGAVVYRVIDPDGLHNEYYWRKWFPEFYGWIMSDGLNKPVQTQ